MKAPEITPVESSNIEGVNFEQYANAEAGVLIVKFNNGTYYRYAGVPAQVAEELVECESAGKYFHEHVRRNFTGLRMMFDAEDGE